MKLKKGLVVPNFGLFTFKRVEASLGTQGRKLIHTPIFYPQPGFCQQYGVAPCAQDSRSPLSNPITPIIVNLVAVGLAAGTSRQEAGSALKDVVRRAGEAASKGKTVHLDFGACAITISGRRFSTQWAASFLQAIRESDDREAVAHKALLRQGSRSMQLTADQVAAATADSTTAPVGGYRAPIVDRPSSQPKSRMLRQSRVAADVEQSRRMEEEQAAPRCRSATPSIVSCQRTASPVPRPRRAATPQLRPPTIPEDVSVLNFSSFDISAQDLPDRLNISSVPFAVSGSLNGRTQGTAKNSEYRKRRQHKAAYRLGRRKDYVDIWNSQIQQQEEVMQAEKERDKSLSLQTQQIVEREKEHEKKTKRDARMKALLVEQENVSLAGQRQTTAPAVFPMGNIFQDREAPVAAKTHVEYLREQIQGKAEQAKLERDRQIAIDNVLAARDRDAYERQQREERESKAATRRMVLAGLNEQVRQKGPKKRFQQETLDPNMSGNFFFKGNDQEMKEADKKERLARRSALKALQAENQLGLRAAKEQTKQEKQDAAAKERQQLAHQQQAYEEARSQERARRMVEKRAMREAWNSQVDERKQAVQASKLHDRSVRTVALWKNDSSDDES